MLLPKSKHTTHRPKKCTPVATIPLGRAYNELGTFITLATHNFEQFGWHETWWRMRSQSDITEGIGRLVYHFSEDCDCCDTEVGALAY